MELSKRGIISNFDRKRPSVKFSYVVCYVVAIGVAISTLYPLLWVCFGSLKEAKEIFYVPPTLLPRTFLWENYLRAWQFYAIPKVFWNTLVIYAGFVGVRLLSLSAAAYALAHMRLPCRRGIYMLFLATLMLPFFAYLIPSYLIIFRLGLLDSFWAVCLPAGADSYSLLLLKNYFDGIPGEIFESARIDGASELLVLRKIVLPLAKPIIAVLGIFAFIHVWRDFVWQRIVLPSAHKWTVSIALWYHSLGNQGAVLPQNVQLAAMLISTLPPMIIFLIFQRYIIEGVSFTGLKG